MYVSSHQKDWDRHIPMILFAYRVSPHASTGESPFFLLYGREPRLPLDAALLMPDSQLSPSVVEHRARIIENLENAQRIVSSNTQLAQLKMKEHYDKTSSPVQHEIGSKVWVYTPKTKKGISKKLLHNFHGPYRIVAKLSPVHFRLRTLDNRPVSVHVHANRMKPYFDPNDRPIQPPPAPEADASLDLADSDLPDTRFEVDGHGQEKVAISDDNTHNVLLPDEPQITRPEDEHELLLITNHTVTSNQGV